jgi:hypothetical protein
MRDDSTADAGRKPPSPSPLRLRLGVAFILLWWAPIWALAPAITHALDGLTNPPSVGAVTTTILVIQTLIGLLGFWVAGTAVKIIVKESPTRRGALRAIWHIFVHGAVEDHSAPADVDSPAPTDEGGPSGERAAR